MLEWKAYLDYQLDSLQDFEFLGGLVMLFGHKSRLHGGAPLPRLPSTLCCVSLFSLTLHSVWTR
jgi:hypothetical protein